MPLTACNYGSHWFVRDTELSNGQHLHICRNCEATYVSVGKACCSPAPTSEAKS